MTWINIIISLIGLLRELIKLIDKHEENKKLIPEKIKAATKLAREKGDTSEIERMLRDLGASDDRVHNEEKG